MRRPEPPRLATRLLRFCLPGTPVGESIAGDLREEHARLSRERGRRSADAWYRREAFSVGLGAAARRAAAA